MTTTNSVPDHPRRDDHPAALAAVIITRSLRSNCGRHTTLNPEPDVLDGLPVTLDIPDAARLLGIGRTTAYTLARQGRFPCPVIKVGQQYRIPTIKLLRLLGLPDTASAPFESNSDHRTL